MKRKALVVENKGAFCRQLASALRSLGYDVNAATTLQEAMTLVDAFTHDLAVIDLMLRDPENTATEGVKVAQRLVQLREGTAIVIISGQQAPQLAADMVQQYQVDKYVDKEVFISEGMQYLEDLVSDLVQSHKIRLYGKADDALSFIAGSGTEAIVWVNQCLVTLRPKEGYSGLKRFLSGFFDPLAPIMPSRDTAERLSLDTDSSLLHGSFWSKALGLPFHGAISPLAGSTDDKAAACLEDQEEGILHRYAKFGLEGIATGLPGSTRAAYVDSLE